MALNPHIEIDGAKMRQLQQERIGNLGHLEKEDFPKRNGRISRYTLIKWRKNQVVPAAYEFLEFCAALDVDPFLLLRSTASTSYFDLCRDIADNAFAKVIEAPEKRPNLPIALLKIFGPQTEWPNSNLFSEHFRRDWVSHEYQYSAQPPMDGYGRFRISTEGSLVDRVWHFAWRDKTRRSWRPYGLVRCEDEGIQLFSFCGRRACFRLQGRGMRAFFVETYFGRGSAEFKVASIHEFSLEYVGQTDSTGNFVRFSVDN